MTALVRQQQTLGVPMNENGSKGSPMAWLLVMGFFGGATLWVCDNLMPWQFAVAAAVVVDMMIAVGLLRNERKFQRDRRLRADVGPYPGPYPSVGHQSSTKPPAALLLIDPLVGSSIRTARAVTSPHDRVLH